jgi:hypothetical protein
VFCHLGGNNIGYYFSPVLNDRHGGFVAAAFNSQYPSHVSDFLKVLIYPAERVLFRFCTYFPEITFSVKKATLLLKFTLKGKKASRNIEKYEKKMYITISGRFLHV